jgi:hypothetical protein
LERAFEDQTVFAFVSVEVFAMVTRDGTTIPGIDAEQVAKLEIARRILEQARAILAKAAKD